MLIPRRHAGNEQRIGKEVPATEQRMSLPSDVLDLIPRARAGDEAAAAALVKRIEPFLMRVVRIRIASTPNLMRSATTSVLPTCASRS